jgi:N-acetylmuramoyl-L-alanine amidase
VVDLERPMQLVSTSQDARQVLELRFRPIDEAGFRRQVSRGRAPVAGFSQEAPRAVPPGPTPAQDPALESAARLDAVEQALAEAGRAMQPAPARAGPMAPGGGPEVQPQPPIDTRAAAAQPKMERQATAAKSETSAAARPARRDRIMVVIDAGHGGHDPGAPSADGRHEKDVTLAVARAARDSLERRARERGVPLTVKLTREDDSFIPLGGRVRLARQWKADLFISIHADSAPNPEARGASVYTLSDVASDKEAARAAAKENRADLIAGVDLSGENRDVANILIDLGMRDSMNASADFAQALQRGMEPKGVRFRSQFHRFAGFQVLRNLGVPAVLIETGYVSNKEDADFLFSKRGQKAIADGIADAVLSYLGKR